MGDAAGNRFDGNAATNRFYGGEGNDELYGNGGADRLFGQGGIDRLEGGTGADWLDGGAGDDWLDGGDGGDGQIYGGAGDDTFVLGLHETPDTIFDHEGSNVLRFAGGDPARFTVQSDGDDLLLGYDGSPLAVIKQYAGHESAFAGIVFGSEVQPLVSSQAQASADLLAEFLEPAGSGGGTAPAAAVQASTTVAAVVTPEPTPQVHVAVIPALEDLWVPPEIDLSDQTHAHEGKHG